MKKIMLTLVGILFATASVSALSYEESRNRAWYLTDKMAYELNLTPEQYDRAYEINLNYFLNVNYPSDIDCIGVTAIRIWATCCSTGNSAVLQAYPISIVRLFGVQGFA